jgi:hypothetical protein
MVVPLLANDTVPDFFVNRTEVGVLSELTDNCPVEAEPPIDLERVFLILPFAAAEMGHPNGLLRAVLRKEKLPESPSDGPVDAGPVP